MSATNRGAIRDSQDFYPTPISSLESILPRVRLTDIETSLEPCRGNDIIFDKLPGIRSWAELSLGVDYLSTSFDSVDLIITNPPFSLALPFLSKSLQEALTVIYLLRLNFLGSRKRRQFWADNPPTHLYVLSSRPSFTGKGTDATEYAWFCWDRGDYMKDKPGIYVL